MECSHWADSDLSRVTAVQPSDSSFTWCLPRFTIGSMVKNMPGRRSSPVPALAEVQDVGRVVEHLAQAMAAEVAHHRAAHGLST